MPKGKKHTLEQTVAILRRLESGEPAKAVCRSVNISAATLYRWKQQYGAQELNEVKELKVLREENARLRRVVADQVLNIQVLKEVSAKNGEPVAEAPRWARLGRDGIWFPASGVPLPWAGPVVVLVPPSQRPTERRVRTAAAVLALSRRYRSYDYRRIHALVERPGHRCALRTPQRVRRQEG
jgi:putative transposase